ncbi:MAG: L-fucose/L-arabinose isomerase family protein [Phycisphaerae bacterium]
MDRMTFGVIVANRGFFPDLLAKEGHANIINVLESNGYGVVVLSEEDSKYGAVETLKEAKKSAELFKANADKIDGIIVTLPNFGDEKGVAETIKRAGLNVPVLIHAESDVANDMTIQHRRDSFCGKLSVCNNLNQAGIPYTLTKSHTVGVLSDEFKDDLEYFAKVCRIVNGLDGVRFGAIGTRPAAFNTVRFSEKILESFNIAVEPIDMFEMIGMSQKYVDNDVAVQAKLQAIKDYVNTSEIAEEALMKMAKFGTAIDRWCEDNDIQATTIQCWTAIEEYFGIVPCTLMSMMSESLRPSACEVDVAGLLGMYILQLAGGTPSALLDWNNNYGNDPDKCVLFHCSNLPKSFFKSADMSYQAIIAGSVGKENACGTIVGRVAPNPVTFLRTSTDDFNGNVKCYLGEGKFTDDPLETFGGYGVMEIPDMQELMRYLCERGFEHHVAVNVGNNAAAIEEALVNYLGWDLYRH